MRIYIIAVLQNYEFFFTRACILYSTKNNIKSNLDFSKQQRILLYKIVLNFSFQKKWFLTYLEVRTIKKFRFVN